MRFPNWILLSKSHVGGHSSFSVTKESFAKEMKSTLLSTLLYQRCKI